MFYLSTWKFPPIFPITIATLRGKDLSRIYPWKWAISLWSTTMGARGENALVCRRTWSSIKFRQISGAAFVWWEKILGCRTGYWVDRWLRKGSAEIDKLSALPLFCFYNYFYESISPIRPFFNYSTPNALNTASSALWYGISWNALIRSADRTADPVAICFQILLRLELSKELRILLFSANTICPLFFFIFFAEYFLFLCNFTIPS